MSATSNIKNIALFTKTISPYERTQTRLRNWDAFWITLYDVPSLSCEELFAYVEIIIHTIQVICVFAAVVSGSLFSIWLRVWREACTQDNRAGGNLCWASEKPFCMMVGRNLVMPGWTHQTTAGSGSSPARRSLVSSLVGLCAGDLTECERHRAKSRV